MGLMAMGKQIVEASHQLLKKEPID